jgi:hypothetical protein
MKNIIKTMFFAFLIITISSCENDKEPIVSANSFQLRTLESVSSFVLLPQDNENTVLTFEWDKVNNGVATQDSNYLLEVAKSGTNFSELIVANDDEFILTDRTYILKVAELNSLLAAAGFQCGVSTPVDVRIKSVLGNRVGNPFIQYSNVITINVTPYSSKTPELAFVTAASEIAASSKMLSKGILNSEFEGYFYLQPGSYKFYQPSACGDFASATAIGGTAGTLDDDSAAPSITVATAGYYLVKANIDANTYSVSQYNYFGIYGKAKSTLLFLNAIAFTDDDHDNVWTLTVDLFKGRKFKLKSNYWTTALTGTPPFVPSSAPIISALGKSSTAGQLVSVDPDLNVTDGLITVPGTDDGTKVTCVITIDVRNSRDYKYTLVTQ